MREAFTPLESELARLPEPAAPAGLTQAVMARVARVDLDRPEMAREAAAEERRGAGAAQGDRMVRGRGRLAAALGASGLAAYAAGLEQGTWTFDPLAWPVADAFTALAAGPESVLAALGLAMVMLLYLAGLLASLGRSPGATTRPPR